MIRVTVVHGENAATAVVAVVALIALAYIAGRGRGRRGADHVFGGPR